MALAPGSALQREAVERLKRQLFGADPAIRRRYIQDFHREFRACRRTLRWDGLIAAARRADIVLVGDYHALPSCQNFATELLESLAGRRRLVLAVEMIFSRHQRLLDRYQAGDLPEAEFLRRIRYEQDWGYAWEGYRKLLAAARRAKVPVVACDASPRGGLSTIRRRDTHAARRLGALVAAEPRTQVLVLFGESHLARGHLPRQLRHELARQGPARRLAVIVQNVEAIYWDLVDRGKDLVRAVEVGDGRYVVFNASPLAKYEAYRQTLDRWHGEVYDDGRPDLSPTVHHIIEMLLKYLGVDPYRHRLRPSSFGVDTLVDGYPDVQQVERPAEVESVLRTDGLSASRARVEAEAFRRRGARYVSGTNSLFLHTFDLALAAEECCRFVLSALSGEIGATAVAGGKTVGLLEEALAWLGSKIVDPSRRPGSRFADPALPMASSLAMRPPPDSGRILGERIYEGLRDGRLTRRDLLRLFSVAARTERGARKALEEIDARLSH